MMKKRVLILSYVPHYNRQGVDLARALREDADVAVYQLGGVENIDTDEHGVVWTRPHGRFSKFHVLWNIIKFVLPTLFRRKDVVVCVGRPILIVGALYKKLLGCRFLFYSLEYSALGRTDRWSISQCDGYIDVEENRCQKVVSDYGLVIPTCVIHNMPPLHGKVTGGALKAWLLKEKSISPDARIVIYAGSYQGYARLPEIIEASRCFPANTYLVLMTYNLPERLLEILPPNCFAVAPVGGDGFYEWLADADVALLPYEQASDFNVQNCSPQKLFDCYLVGVPYLASDRPLIKKTLEALPTAGAVCDFTDKMKIASGVSSLLTRKAVVRDAMMLLHRQQFNYAIAVAQVKTLILQDE